MTRQNSDASSVPPDHRLFASDHDDHGPGQQQGFKASEFYGPPTLTSLEGLPFGLAILPSPGRRGMATLGVRATSKRSSDLKSNQLTFPLSPQETASTNVHTNIGMKSNVELSHSPIS